MNEYIPEMISAPGGQIYYVEVHHRETGDVIFSGPTASNRPGAKNAAILRLRLMLVSTLILDADTARGSR